MTLGTVIFLLFAGLGVLGYLCYGWLLLEALSSEKDLLASFTFANLARADISIHQAIYVYRK